MPERNRQGEIARLRERERKSRPILNVSEAADTKKIRPAFGRASPAYHPDVKCGLDNPWGHWSSWSDVGEN